MLAYQWGNLAISLKGKPTARESLLAGIASVALEPENPYNWGTLAQIAEMHGEHIIASNCLERAVNLDEGEDLLRELYIDSLLESRQLRRCISEGKKARRAFPRRRALMEYIGLAYQELGNQKMAIRWFKCSEKGRGDSILESSSGASK